jgi:hypothetical protein
VAPPPLTRNKLSLPGDAGELPRPAGERTSAAAPSTRELAVPPSAGDRPAGPNVATAPSPAPVPIAVARPAPLPPAPQAAPASQPDPPPAQQAEIAPPPPPAPSPSAPAARPAPSEQTATAAPAQPRRRPPDGPPLTTVIFTPRSANLSEGARIALGFFAQDPKTQRLRRIELWASASADDPVDAGKIAFARALAVHAFLIDMGVKAEIEIAGYSEATGGGTPDRVDVMTR